MTEVILFSLLLGYDFTPQEAGKMVCIAKAESGLNETKVNSVLNRNGTVDYGLFQINSIWLDECGVEPRDLLDAYVNIACASNIFKQRGFYAWSTWRKCK